LKQNPTISSASWKPKHSSIAFFDHHYLQHIPWENVYHTQEENVYYTFYRASEFWREKNSIAVPEADGARAAAIFFLYFDYYSTHPIFRI
jgi:hypothetical protein